MKKLLMSLLVLASCAVSKEQVENLQIINISEVNNDLTTEMFFKDCTIIPLETNNNSIIGGIGRIILYDNKIYVFDSFTHSVKLFDENGRYYKNISHEGKGPLEYITLSDVAFNYSTKELVFYCDRPQKLIFLDEYGEFKREQTVDELATRFSIVDDVKILYHPFFREENEYFVSLYKNGTATKFIKNELGYEKYIGTLYPNILISSKLHLTVPLSNYIYGYDEESKAIKPIISLNLGRKELPENLPVNNNQLQMNQIRKDYYYSPYNFRESANFISFSLNPAINCIYSKAKKETYVFNSLRDLDFGLFLNNYFAHDGDENVMLFILEPQFLLKALDYMPENIKSESKRIDELESIAKNIKAGIDNPIIMKFDFK